MIADILDNKKHNPIVTELFIRGRKLNISLHFITRSFFTVRKNIRLNLVIHEILTFKTLWIFTKKCTGKTYSFSVIDVTFSSDNSLSFSKNVMAIDYNIKDENLRYDINRGVAEISALRSRKCDKYEYLTGKEIITFDQMQSVEQATFPYSPVGKAFEKQTKMM